MRKISAQKCGVKLRELDTLSLGVSRREQPYGGNGTGTQEAGRFSGRRQQLKKGFWKAEKQLRIRAWEKPHEWESMGRLKVVLAHWETRKGRPLEAGLEKEVWLGPPCQLASKFTGMVVKSRGKTTNRQRAEWELERWRDCRTKVEKENSSWSSAPRNPLKGDRETELWWGPAAFGGGPFKWRELCGVWGRLKACMRKVWWLAMRESGHFQSLAPGKNRHKGDGWAQKWHGAFHGLLDEGQGGHSKDSRERWEFVRLGVAVGWTKTLERESGALTESLNVWSGQWRGRDKT